MKDRNGRQHHLRVVSDPNVEVATLRDDWLDPIGAKHTDGRVYIDSKIPRKSSRKNAAVGAKP